MTGRALDIPRLPHTTLRTSRLATDRTMLASRPISTRLLRIGFLLVAALWLGVQVEPARAQADTGMRLVGDSTFRSEVVPRTRAIRAQEGEWTFALTTEGAVSLDGAQGVELRGKHVGGCHVWIVAAAWTGLGKYSAEYYFEGDSLLMSYETLEYFSEKEPGESWRNFRDLAAWERRSYFDGQTVRFAESVGVTAPDPGDGAKDLIAAAMRARAILDARRR